MKRRVKAYEEILKNGEASTHYIKYSEDHYFCEEMEEYCGKDITLTIPPHSDYTYTNGRWFWIEAWLEPEKRIICGGE